MEIKAESTLKIHSKFEVELIEVESEDDLEIPDENYGEREMSRDFRLGRKDSQKTECNTPTKIEL